MQLNHNPVKTTIISLDLLKLSGNVFDGKTLIICTVYMYIYIILKWMPVKICAFHDLFDFVNGACSLLFKVDQTLARLGLEQKELIPP
jgi:hypothetical protein